MCLYASSATFLLVILELYLELKSFATCLAHEVFWFFCVTTLHVGLESSLRHVRLFTEKTVVQLATFFFLGGIVSLVMALLASKQNKVCIITN